MDIELYGCRPEPCADTIIQREDIGRAGVAFPIYNLPFQKASFKRSTIPFLF
jgi:hypothetical protein